jgi:hypothetical protein
MTGSEATSSSGSEARQETLWVLAYEGLTVNAWRDAWGRWEARVKIRRGDEKWSDVAADLYEHLTTPELVDVLGAVADQLDRG